MQNRPPLIDDLPSVSTNYPRVMWCWPAAPILPRLPACRRLHWRRLSSVDPSILEIFEK